MIFKDRNNFYIAIYISYVIVHQTMVKRLLVTLDLSPECFATSVPLSPTNTFPSMLNSPLRITPIGWSMTQCPTGPYSLLSGN